MYREFEFSLPNNWSIALKKLALKNIMKELSKSGMCCTGSIHEKKNNSHCHIIASLRKYENGKFLPKKTNQYVLDKDGNKIPELDKNGKQKVEKGTNRKKWKRKTLSNDFSDRSFLLNWRKMVCEKINQFLVSDKKLDHRNFQARGIDRIATVHHYGIPERKALNDRIRLINNQQQKEGVLSQIITPTKSEPKETLNVPQRGGLPSRQTDGAKSAPRQTDGRDRQAPEGATAAGKPADRSDKSSLPESEPKKVVKVVKKKTKAKSSKSLHAHEGRDSVKDAYNHSRQLTKWERQEQLINMHQ